MLTPQVVAESLTQRVGHESLRTARIAFWACSLHTWRAIGQALPCGSSHDLRLSSEVSPVEEGVQGAAGSGDSPWQSAPLKGGSQLGLRPHSRHPETKVSLPVSSLLTSLGCFVFWHKDRACVSFHVGFTNQSYHGAHHHGEAADTGSVSQSP